MPLTEAPHTCVCANWHRYVFSISSVAANVFFVAFIMMSSIGYALVRTSVTNREKQLAIFAFILYSVFDLQSTICTDPTLCQAYEVRATMKMTVFAITCPSHAPDRGRHNA